MISHTAEPASLATDHALDVAAFYQLPAVHAALRATGAYDTALVADSFASIVGAA